MAYDDRYDPDTDFDRWFTVGTGRAISPWIRSGDRVLELGCATGLMSVSLVAAGASVTGVDRSDAYLERARARGIPGAEFLQGEVTDLALGRQFDHVVATNLAQEVREPSALMAVVAAHLRPGGLTHLTVPNPRSLHRLVGVEMGLLEEIGRASCRERVGQYV